MCVAPTASTAAATFSAIGSTFSCHAVYSGLRQFSTTSAPRQASISAARSKASARTGSTPGASWSALALRATPFTRQPFARKARAAASPIRPAAPRIATVCMGLSCVRMSNCRLFAGEWKFAIFDILIFTDEWRMTELDWNLIRSFVAVAETGSLSGAARRLGASQPTLGRHVAELEAALAVTLFRRGRSGYELTEAGLALYGRGKAVAEQAAAFARLAQGRTETIAGTVRVTASEVIAACALPAMMARLAVVEPDIEVEIVASNQVTSLLRRD